MAQYRVTAQSLNLREAPSIDGAVVGFLRREEVVTLLERSEDHCWFKVQTSLGETGWASHKYLVKLAARGEIMPGDPIWFVIAMGEIGVHAIPGSEHHPRIVEYHQTTTYRATTDEVPWCSSFVNWCFQQAGYEGSNSAKARSWLDWGRALDDPQRGCVVVLERGSGTEGHVGFFAEKSGSAIKLLGGNQSNSVRYTDFQSNRLLGYRWPGTY